MSPRTGQPPVDPTGSAKIGPLEVGRELRSDLDVYAGTEGLKLAAAIRRLLRVGLDHEWPTEETMNVYKIERQGDTGYDEAVGFVVSARNAEEARDVVSRQCGDEGAGPWFDPTTVVQEIGTSVSDVARVELRDFHAG